MKIGLVGLGRMGRAIQARLADSGFDVIGWDRDAAAMKPPPNAAWRSRRIPARSPTAPTP